MTSEKDSNFQKASPGSYKEILTEFFTWVDQTDPAILYSEYPGKTKNNERMQRVYICCPYSNNPEYNIERIQKICRSVVNMGSLPIAPQLYLPQFIEEATDRAKAMKLCVELLRSCDAVWVYGGQIYDGMLVEITAANNLKIPIVHRCFPHLDDVKHE